MKKYDESDLLFKVVGESVSKEGGEEKYLYNIVKLESIKSDLLLLYILLPIGIVILLIAVFLIIRKIRKSHLTGNIENIQKDIDNDKERALL